MAVVYGRMQPFVPETETISASLERLHLLFDANGTADTKKVSVLLTVIGAELNLHFAQGTSFTRTS
jgi:hypothetical protein